MDTQHRIQGTSPARNGHRSAHAAIAARHGGRHKPLLENQTEEDPWDQSTEAYPEIHGTVRLMTGFLLVLLVLLALLGLFVSMSY